VVGFEPELWRLGELLLSKTRMSNFKCRRCGKDIRASSQLFQLGEDYGWFCLACAASVKTDKPGKAGRDELSQKIKELFESSKKNLSK
jgi:hypothetical protein